MTVGTVRTSYGEVTAKVETSIARQGPKGTAAEFSTHLSVRLSITATFTIKGTCQAVTGFSFTGSGAGGAARFSFTNYLKRLGFWRGVAKCRSHAKTCQLGMR